MTSGPAALADRILTTPQPHVRSARRSLARWNLPASGHDRWDVEYRDGEPTDRGVA